MTFNLLPLMRVESDPRFWLFEQDRDIAYNTVMGWAESGLTCRAMRGHKMRTEKALCDEFGAALQFPWYFGENWDALSDCLRDLAWLPPQSGYVLVIYRSLHMLADAMPDERKSLIRVLYGAQRQWAEPVEQGEPWDRPAVPFHVVLQASRSESADVVRIWTVAGAAVMPLEPGTGE
jgi:RNAse (barnase) inhibitor barstar